MRIELDEHQAKLMMACIYACVRSGGGSDTFSLYMHIDGQLGTHTINKDDNFWPLVGRLQREAFEEVCEGGGLTPELVALCDEHAPIEGSSANPGAAS